MTERMTRAAARVLAFAARLLPPDRRQWADAVEAEAGQVPAGWPRLTWLAGGVWMTMRAAGTGRKVGYWIGIAGVLAAAGWAVWLSWHTPGAADPETMTDRVRVLVGAAALAGLPWVARRRGLLGPVADSIVARAVRIGGCAAICAMGLAVVRIDKHAGINGVVGSGRFSWPREACGLLVLIAAVGAPAVLRAWRPQTEAAVLWLIAAAAYATALVFLPLQAFAVGVAVLVLGATARRSPVTPAIWTAGLIASLPTAAAAIVLPFALDDLISAMLFVAIVTLAVAACAGAAAARRVTGTGNPDELRAARLRHGLLAGLIAGVAGGLIATAATPILGEMIFVGLVTGFGGGVIGGSIVANRRDQPVAGGLPAVEAPGGVHG
jgi:hypothetical protein